MRENCKLEVLYIYLNKSNNGMENRIKTVKVHLNLTMHVSSRHPEPFVKLHNE